MNQANLLEEWARLLCGSLAAAGVRDVVVSPGARSTPLVCAVHSQPELRCWDVIDERAAAFFALGQARVTGRPSLLLCTSGTAGAHYLPAVIEAGAAQLPLLVLTADRPFELQDCGAAQTIDQVKLFGGHVRRYIELGLPDASDLALRALRRTAAQAVLTTTWPTPGAVHLNARARKPLEPQTVHTEEEVALRAHCEGLLQTPIVRAYPPRAVPDPAGVAAVAEQCRSVERGLILCGPAALAQSELRAELGALALATGFPILADATSQARFGLPAAAPRCDAFDVLLRCPGGLLAEDIQLLLQVGAPSIASGVELLLRPDLPQIVLSSHAACDPASTAQTLLLGEVALTVRALLAALPPPPAAGPARPWAAKVRHLDELAWQVLDEQLAAAARTGFGEAAAVRATVSELSPGSVLMVGNSLPIREVDALCPGQLAELDVLSQRGASGIDGLLAGAAGAATVLSRPLTLLVGDISALHDLSALPLLLRARVPVVVVVLQNHGGRIFEQLPLACSPAAHADPTLLTHFTTPHALHLEPAARMYGLAYAAVRDEAALRMALQKALAPAPAGTGPRVTLIEAIVPASSAADHQHAYSAALTAALMAHRERTP
jgi:2-succinyl-5-enolpyruvyl-6-hydroxy-3-cyclohexene-1-carboxylate synthase